MADPTPELKTEEIGEGPSPAGSGKKKLLIRVVGLFILVGAGLTASLYFFPNLFPPGLRVWGPKGQKTEQKHSQPEKQGHIYSMDPFLVNLADAEIPRYLKVKIDMESQDAKPSEEYEKRLPQLRDAFLTILSAKTYPEIYDSEGKKKLKEEILQKTNQLLGTFKVKKIYFNEFVVQ
jgi:flagellar FliL protein